MWRKLTLEKVSLAVAGAMLAALFVALQSASALTVSPVVIEYDVEPGQTIVGTVKLLNEGEGSETYYPNAQDFIAGEGDGVPQFVGMSETRSLVDWVSFDKSAITLAGGSGDLVVYRISVPENAQPGGYFGGLLFSTQRPNVTEGVGAVAQSGPLVLLRVAGDVVERGAVTSFSAEQPSSTSLPVDFNVTFANSGTVHVKPQGVIRVTNMFGGTAAVIPVNEDGGNVLPDSDRSFMSTWQKAELPENASELVKEWRNYGFGPYTATLIMNYGETNQVVSATTNFWVMPWMLLVLFIILLVILALLVMQYNKWIIAQAKKK